MRRLRAEALNAAGRGAFRVGSVVHRVGLALCGLGGTLDAWADTAGYWDWRAKNKPVCNRLVAEWTDEGLAVEFTTPASSRNRSSEGDSAA